MIDNDPAKAALIELFGRNCGLIHVEQGRQVVDAILANPDVVLRALGGAFVGYTRPGTGYGSLSKKRRGRHTHPTWQFPTPI